MTTRVVRDRVTKDWAVYDGTTLIGYRSSYKEAFALACEYQSNQKGN